MFSEKIYTPEEISEHWRVTTQAINDLIASGQLRATKFAGQVRITESALNEYIAQVNGSVRSTNSVQSDVAVNLGPTADFAHKWPDGSKEPYTHAQEGTASYLGRDYAVKVGFTTRESAGKDRRRSLVLVNRYPTVQFTSDGTNGNGLMASIIKDRAGKQLPIGATPPVEYANLRIGAYQQVVSGVGASNGLAVLCDANDVRTMVVHALIRTLFRKQR